MLQMILFPSSYSGISRVDEDLQKEYDAAANTGLYELCLFGYDKWFRQGQLTLSHRPEKPTAAVYRGWMMKPEQYEQFYQQLSDNNIQLITSPDEYRMFHVFPDIYPMLSDDTAGMILFPEGTAVDLSAVRKRFERFMVKDYVKSVKGTKFPSCFDNTITQDEFDDQMEIFYKYRGGLFTGGICIKEFLDLRKYHSRTNEYRVYYINHETAAVNRNSGQGSFTPEPPAELLVKYRNLSSPFYTIDYAELTDGSWKIIEAGDGQVSGLSEGQDHEAFFRALHQCFKEAEQLTGVSGNT